MIAVLKADLSEVVKSTIGWDDAVSLEVRSKWVENFWKIEKLKGIKFTRARMPLDAVDCQMRMITLVDAAMGIIMLGTWVGFKRQNGLWSCQHLIGRPLLAKEDSTIPKNELQGLTAGSNLQWVVRQALQDWISCSIIASDSSVALCWASTDNKPLAIFQRNRAIQIRRSVELSDLYHVRTDCNPSDVGTRPDKVCLEDIGPNSRWENGDDWMKKEIAEAVDSGVLKPVSELRIKDEEENEFRKGLVFEKVPEVLTRGHVISEARVSKMEERVNFSQYLVLPTKFSFNSVVRILSHVMRFISACRRGKTVLSQILYEGKLWFSVFVTVDYSGQSNNILPQIGMVTSTISNNQHEITQRASHLISHVTSDLLVCQRNNFANLQVDHTSKEPTDRFINMALLYLYRKASSEVKQFCKKEFVNRISTETEGVLLSKGRLLDCMNYRDTGELSGIILDDLGVKSNLPVIERYSPLAYSIADHLHWNVAVHRGVETCTRVSKENVFIIQAHSLFKELAQDCIMCKKKRKRFLEVEMGPISDSQLSIAPPFWMCQVDLFGPIIVVVPGFEKATRNRRVLEAKCWVMAVVCPTTRLVNLQVLESSKSAGWLDAFTRLSCEVGCPSHVFCDQDSAGMKAFEMVDVELRDLQLRLSREKGIKLSVCPVMGHDRHGHVERVIRSIQESFMDSGLVNSVIHATGLQTVCKLVENQYNNLPLGYHYGRDENNSALLKIITPNMLRVGRVNKRSVDGPMRLPKDRSEILAKVCETYDSWFKIWSECMVPKLLFQPKWFKTEESLKVKDLVYFPKEDTNLSNKWIMGIVDKLEHGRDGRIRRLWVRYRNSNEDQDRVTDRTVRKVVKLWSIEDTGLAEDLAELGRRFEAAKLLLDGVGGQADTDVQLDGQVVPHVEEDVPARNTRSRCAKCCCVFHHELATHLRRDQLGKVADLAVDLDSRSLVNLIVLEDEEDGQRAFTGDCLDDVLGSTSMDLKF